jgi:hypothetical protein
MPLLTSGCGVYAAIGGGGTKAIDGSATGQFSLTNTGTVSLTTSTANVIILTVHNQKVASAQTVSTVTSSHLTWARRTSDAWVDTVTVFADENMEIWWAHASGPLSSEVITVTLTGAIDDASMVAFGVTNCATPTAPWDSNGAVPAFADNVSSSPANVTVSGVSTTSTSPMVIGFIATGGSYSPGIPTGTTSIASVRNVGGSTGYSYSSAFYHNYSSALSSASFTTTSTSGNVGMIIDALL